VITSGRADGALVTTIADINTIGEEDAPARAHTRAHNAQESSRAPLAELRGTDDLLWVCTEEGWKVQDTA
jgi:hypothetical protein